jgi:hypothetical protein
MRLQASDTDKKGQTTEERRKVYSEKLHNLYSYLSKQNEIGGACSTHKGNYSYKVLVERLGGKRTLGRSGVDLRETRYKDFNWRQLVQNSPIMGSCEYSVEYWGAIKAGNCNTCTADYSSPQ